jgi:hypothetical protein
VEKWQDEADDEQLFLSVVSLAVLPPGKRRQELQQWIEEMLRPWYDGRILPVMERIAQPEWRLRGRPSSSSRLH